MMKFRSASGTILVTGGMLFFLGATSYLKAGASVELGTGYNVPLGAWSDAYGAGMAYRGKVTFSFGEFLNPGIGGFLLFPALGSIVVDEYQRVHNTEYVSLFAVSGLVNIDNRMLVALSDRSTLTFDVGYGFFAQRDYATVYDTRYESVDYLSGHGPLLGLGFRREIELAVFDFIHPFLIFYYSPNKVEYHVVSPGASVEDHIAGENRMGIIIGITLISVGEE